MRSRYWLILWILGILFPMAFLGSLWPAFGRVFNSTFASNWAHIAMHSFLYAVLAFLFSRWIRPDSLKTTCLLLGLALLVGFLQESVQLLAAHGWSGFAPAIAAGWPAEVFDLMVDLGGAGVGLLLAKKPGRERLNHLFFGRLRR